MTTVYQFATVTFNWLTFLFILFPLQNDILLKDQVKKPTDALFRRSTCEFAAREFVALSVAPFERL